MVVGEGSRRVRTAQRAGDGLMEFELHSPEPVCHVDVIDSLDKDLPGVCMVVWNARGLRVVLRVKGSRCCTEDERAGDLRALDALAQIAGRCHDVVGRCQSP